MLEIKREGNKITAQLPLSENATGLRDIIAEYANENGANIKDVAMFVGIDCSPDRENHITVSFTRKVDSADGTVMGEPKGSSYTLKDEPAIVEYEIDPETGIEIEGTRLTIKEENLHLTDWDSSLGGVIAQGILNHLKTV